MDFLWGRGEKGKFHFEQVTGKEKMVKIKIRNDVQGDGNVSCRENCLNICEIVPFISQQTSSKLSGM